MWLFLFLSRFFFLSVILALFRTIDPIGSRICGHFSLIIWIYRSVECHSNEKLKLNSVKWLRDVLNTQFTHTHSILWTHIICTQQHASFHFAIISIQSILFILPFSIFVFTNIFLFVSIFWHSIRRCFFSFLFEQILNDPVRFHTFKQ